MKIEKYFAIERETALKLIEATNSRPHEKSGDNGFQATKVFLIGEYAVLKSRNMNFRNVTVPDENLEHLEKLAKTLLELKADGVNVMPILAFMSEDGEGYSVQQRAKGAELYEREKISDKDYVLKRAEQLAEAPQEHFDKFITDAAKIMEAGILIDFAGKDNFFYDKEEGFQFIDLNAHFDYVYGLTDEKPPCGQILIYNAFAPFRNDTFPALNEKIFEKCNAALINAGFIPR